MPVQLETRFTEPDGFKWDYIERHCNNNNARRIRTGCLLPESPKANIVLLQGLSEFGEKYFEFARELQAQNIGLWLMDWYGQGGSGRYLDNPHKRHAENFDHYIADMDYFIETTVKPSTVKLSKSAPLILLGHSMGGHIGLRYLAQHPDIFAAAAFTAPFLGISEVAKLPAPLKKFIAGTMHTIMPTRYVLGHTNWRKEVREMFGLKTLSSDPAREKLHNYWCMKKEELQVGGVTWGWINAAINSCETLKGELHRIRTPSLIARAGREKIVDNGAITKGAAQMPDATILEIEDSLHEILMERDEIRDKFIDEFFSFIQPYTA